MQDAANSPIVMSEEQFQRLIETLKSPSAEEKAQKEKQLSEQQEMRRVAAEGARREVEQKAARQANCPHQQGSKLTERGLSVGQDSASAVCINWNPQDQTKSFAICQHCQRVWHYGCPEWNEIVRRAA